MADDLSKKPKQSIPESFKPRIFPPGQSGNPAGRPPGARTRFSEAFCHDILMDWQEHGMKVVREVREKDPSTYLRVAASLIPKQFTMNNDDTTLDRFLNGLGSDELNELITGLRALGAAKPGAKDETAPQSADEPSSVH